MSKRVKKVYETNDGVAHAWASRASHNLGSEHLLEYGRNSGRSMFFEGDVIYSYGYHYPMARIVRPDDTNTLSESIVLINSNGYSNTTSKHTQSVRYAINQLHSYDVPDIMDVESAIKEMQDRAWESAFNLLRGRMPWYGMRLPLNKLYREIVNEETVRDALDNWFFKGNELCDVFKVDDTQHLPQDLKDVLVDFTLTQYEKYRQRTKLKEHQQRVSAARRKWHVNIVKSQNEILRRLDYKEGLNAWLSGESNVRLPGSIYRIGLPRLNRDRKQELIRINDNEIETTGGASVPLNHGLAALLRLESGKSLEGRRLGHFVVSKLDKENNSLVVGCHNLNLRQAIHVLKKHLKENK